MLQFLCNIFYDLRNVTESFQYTADEMNGYFLVGVQVSNPPGYIWGQNQKSKFTYLDQTMCGTTFTSPTVQEVFQV